MSNAFKSDQKFIRIDLTNDQQVKVLNETGKQAEAIELTISEFEDRIAPRMVAP